MLSHAQRLLAAVLFAGALAACAGVSGSPTTAQPTAQPSGAPTAAAQPSATTQPTVARPTATTQPTAVAQPTAARPTAVAQPTAAQPAPQPTFGFDPREGVAGAQINLTGWNFAPGSDIAVRLGTPQPVGEALTSARVDAAGRWAGSFVLPANLPSGQPVPAGQIALVVMDANTNATLASAPFSYQVAGGPTRQQASQTVAGLLHAVGTQAAWGYLASNLSHDLPVEQALGLNHHWVTYDVGAPLDRPSEVLFVPAVLIDDAKRHYYEFSLVVERGEWKVSGARWLHSELPPQEPAASRPGVYDYSNVGTVTLGHLRPGLPGKPIIVGAVAVAGEYAAAYALPYGEAKQFFYLRQAPGAGWEVALVAGDPTPEALASAGIPRSLLKADTVPAIVDTLIAYYSSPAYGGADGWLSVDAIDGGYARATLHRSADGDLTIYLRASSDGWAWLIDGQMFAPEALDQLGIPGSVR
ncbi:MAG: hypothetical protein IPO81_13510 [Kouleothrix sp.]|nr:hypothetical protein [Kouleothrix sp.]